MNGLRMAGVIWALYIDANYIEQFDSVESAKAFAEANYKGLNYFVKPVVFFSFAAVKEVSR